MNPVHELKNQVGSIWLDDVYRDGLEADKPKRWIAEGWVRGIMFSSGLRLDKGGRRWLDHPDLRLLAHAFESPINIIAQRSVDEIRATADRFLPLFEKTNGEDGFVCIDIEPHSYGETQTMIDQTMMVWTLVNRPNLMVSIPATRMGIPAIHYALDQGVNVNAIMLSSIERYLEVVETYFNALEARLERGSGIDHIVSVASFYLTDIDQHIDRKLEIYSGAGGAARRAAALSGHIGLATAKLAYAQFKVSFSDERFAQLVEKGGRVQRILWTRLSPPSEHEVEIDYLGQLIGPQTIAAPSAKRLEAFILGGQVDATLDEGLSEARGQLQALEAIGLSLDDISADIEQSLIRDRITGYEESTAIISQRCAEYQHELEAMSEPFKAFIEKFETQEVSQRIWGSDGTLWSNDRKVLKSIPEKMGWLNLPLHASDSIEECGQYVKTLLEEDIRSMVFLGSGSMASFIHALGELSGEPANKLLVIDPSNSEDVERMVRELEIECTAFLLATDSQDVREVDELTRNWWRHIQDRTALDPGDLSTLIAYPATTEKVNKERLPFRHTFSIPADIPYHFASLSYPGMITAEWLGLDPQVLVDGLTTMMNRCLSGVPIRNNPGLSLAAAIAAGIQAGFEPIYFAADHEWGPLKQWAKDLLEDSNISGQVSTRVAIDFDIENGSDVEPKPMVIFFNGDEQLDSQAETPVPAGTPIKFLDLSLELKAVGSLVGLWTFTVAALGYLFGVNPFDTP